MTKQGNSILSLGNDNDGILRKVSERVAPEDIPNVQETVDQMFAALTAAGGLGLAAPQIGINKQIFILSDGTVCINPFVIFKSKRAYSYSEGCLSIEGKRYDIKRYKEITINYFDRQGKLRVLKSRKKIISFAIQHEIDHLNGKLICDYEK